MREVARKIMVIDDLANRQHDCDLLLDQNFYLDAQTRYQNLVPPTATCLLGPEYALLRPEFYEARANLRERNGEVKRVLVCMGGSDPDNVTGKVVEALKDKAFSKLEIDVVVGPSNPHARSIEGQISGRANFHLLQDAPNMAELMADADFAIGGGGAMTWERWFMKLPSLVLPIAPNQKVNEASQGFPELIQEFFDIDYQGRAQSVSETFLSLMTARCNNPRELTELNHDTSIKDNLLSYLIST
jgi:UDP-2,4-diacetamido-2,4,6-trideoxy-beta-L-altropyranose hydrolase